jgi:AraC-like DNA-binding protein
MQATLEQARTPRVELTGQVRFAQRLVQKAGEHGLPRQELLSGAGLRDEDLRHPDDRIPHEKIIALWRILVERVPDSALGVRLGETTPLRGLGLVGYTMLHSRSLVQALERLARYAPILSEASALRLRRQDDQLALVVALDPGLRALRRPVDAALAALLSWARELAGREVQAVQISFPYDPLRCAGAHRRFFDAALSWSSSESAIVFRGGDLELPVACADESLGDYLVALAEHVLEGLERGGSWSVGVERALWAALVEGSPSLERTAARLGMSARTLQRRFQERGTSFSDVLGAVRHRMALSLLRDRSIPVYEVAALLGYSEPSTFYRAFRRWQGVTPFAFRRSLG